MPYSILFYLKIFFFGLALVHNFKYVAGKRLPIFKLRTYNNYRNLFNISNLMNFYLFTVFL